MLPYLKLNPSLLVKVYDAIQICNNNQQITCLSNISEYIELPLDNVEHIVRLACDEGFLLASGKECFSIPHYDTTPLFRHDHDSFCHNCHGSGQVLECETCWRVSHARCCPVNAPTSKGKFICSMCRQLRNEKSGNLDPKKLNRLLIFIICILRERFKEHGLDPERLKNQIYRILMFNYVSFDTLEERIAKNEYRTSLEFLCDVQSMFHCFVLATGSECTHTADLLYNYAHYELDELELCPTCYLLSNTKPENWFSIPCNPPHRLVYAKQKGYSYWPAKIVKSVKPHRDELEGMDDTSDDEANSFDVRYFGGNHERAFIEIDCLKPVETTDLQKLVSKRSLAFTKALDELSVLQKYLADGPSKYLPIVDALWAVSDWPLEIENEKARKCQLIQGGNSNNGKSKRGRGKSTVSHRSTPTPTNSSMTGTAEGDSRDASISELIDSPGVSTTVPSRNLEKETSTNMSTSRTRTTTNLTSVKSSEKKPQSTLKKKETSKMAKVNGEDKKAPPVETPSHSTLSSPGFKSEPRNKTTMPLINASRTKELVESAKTSNQTSSSCSSKNVLSNAIIKPEKLREVSAKLQAQPSRTPVQTVSSNATLPKSSPVKTESPTKPPLPTGPCPPRSLCAEAYERKLAELKREFEVKMKQCQEKFEAERRNDLVAMERRNAEEIAKIQNQHQEEILSVKRKQWCINCSQEAFFPCCWNTAYCSQSCQQEHWYHEHKRFCRRRRTQDSSGAGNATSQSAGTVSTPSDR